MLNNTYLEIWILSSCLCMISSKWWLVLKRFFYNCISFYGPHTLINTQVPTAVPNIYAQLVYFFLRMILRMAIWGRGWGSYYSELFAPIWNQICWCWTDMAYNVNYDCFTAATVSFVYFIHVIFCNLRPRSTKVLRHLIPILLPNSHWNQW